MDRPADSRARQQAGRVEGGERRELRGNRERKLGAAEHDGVALYCMVGPRARKGESALLASGYESVLHLAGGLSAWQAKGFPVDTGP